MPSSTEFYLDKLDKYTQYLNLLNEPTAKLISILTKVNPRNVSEVARALGLSPSLTHYYLKKLMNNDLLRISAKINYNKIGLRPAEVLLEVSPSKRKFVREILTNHDFGYYMASCHGRINGYYTRFAIPHGKEVEFQLFLNELEKYNLIKSYDLLWIESIVYNSKWFNWFDFRKKRWIFRWEDWLKEVNRSSSIKLNFVTDNLPSPINPDYIDIFILKELYKDACISFKEIAKRIGLTAPAIRYHYYNHIVRFNFISGYRPIVLPYPMSISDMHIFRIVFEDREYMKRFVASLDGKPFSMGTAIVMGENEVSTSVYLPKTELSNFIDTLIDFADDGIIEDFNYVTLNLRDYRHTTISYICFKNGKWIYNHERYINEVIKVAEKVERIYSL